MCLDNSAAHSSRWTSHISCDMMCTGIESLWHGASLHCCASFTTEVALVRHKCPKSRELHPSQSVVVVSTLGVHRWRQLTAPIAAARVPYGLVLGNHDDEADLMRQEVVDLDMKLRSQGSLTRMGPKEAIGLSNYHLDIAASRTSSAPAARIWMLDSAGLGCSWIAAGS